MKTWQGIELKEQESSIKKEDKFKMKYDNSHYGRYKGIFKEGSMEFDKLISSIQYIYRKDKNIKSIGYTIANAIREAIAPVDIDDFNRIKKFIIDGLKSA